MKDGGPNELASWSQLLTSLYYFIRICHLLAQLLHPNKAKETVTN